MSIDSDRALAYIKTVARQHGYVEDVKSKASLEVTTPCWVAPSATSCDEGALVGWGRAPITTSSGARDDDKVKEPHLQGVPDSEILVGATKVNVPVAERLERPQVPEGPEVSDDKPHIGFKKARDYLLVILKIMGCNNEIKTIGQRRSPQAKMRCEFAQVLAILDLVNYKEVTTAKSIHNSKFIYRTGETVIPDSFDFYLDNVCSAGIHYFLDPEVALMYELSEREIIKGFYKSWTDDGLLTANTILYLEDRYRTQYNSNRCFGYHSVSIQDRAVSDHIDRVFFIPLCAIVAYAMLRN